MSQEFAEQIVQQTVQALRLGVEAIGATIIAFGVVVALVQLIRSSLIHHNANFNSIRLLLARYLALALEFQLAADILSTAVAPSPDKIKMLGAIAVIRTGLNYFLGREMREEQDTVQGEQRVQRDAAS